MRAPKNGATAPSTSALYMPATITRPIAQTGPVALIRQMLGGLLGLAHGWRTSTFMVRSWPAALHSTCSARYEVPDLPNTLTHAPRQAMSTYPRFLHCRGPGRPHHACH
jgi:hypothetical protein